MPITDYSNAEIDEGRANYESVYSSRGADWSSLVSDSEDQAEAWCDLAAASVAEITAAQTLCLSGYVATDGALAQPWASLGGRARCAWLDWARLTDDERIACEAFWERQVFIPTFETTIAIWWETKGKEWEKGSGAVNKPGLCRQDPTNIDLWRRAWVDAGSPI